MAAGQPITVSTSIGDPQTGTIKGNTVIPAPSLGNVPICPDALVSLAATSSGDQQIYPSGIAYANIQALGFVATLVTPGTGTPSVVVKLKGATGASAVNAIYPFAVVDSSGVGTFTITVEGVTTAPITYSNSYTSLENNINAALTAAGIGATCGTQGTANLADLILTFNGGNYAGRPIASVSVTVTTVTSGSWTVNGNSFAAGTVGDSYTITASTSGVSPDVRYTLTPSQGSPNGVAFAGLPPGIAANITQITCTPSADGAVVEVTGKIYVTT